ncbi:DMT family transporter [Salinicoccus albus]|uniref:DMT family transporter n=1 Tax=Salinicoccus albus TaxID=418756 RepID=UPI00037A0F90|nr:DMT family transporter [Salinicoccus albus]
MIILYHDIIAYYALMKYTGDENFIMKKLRNTLPHELPLWLIYPILMLCVVIWGSNFIIGKILLDHFDPYSITVIRLIAINIFLWVFSSRYFTMPKVPWKVWGILVISGIIGIAGNQYTFFLGLVTANPVTSALILALAPITTAILTLFIFNEKRGVKFWTGAVLAFAGVTLSTVDGGSIVFGIGESVIILTMLTFAIFMVLIQWLSKYLNAIQITLLTNIFGLLVMIPFLPAANLEMLRSANLSMWLLLIISGIIVHGLSNMIWNKEMPKVGAANASLLMNMEPFVAMIGAVLVLGTSILITEILGAILIVLGVTLSLYRQRQNKSEKIYEK